MASTSSDASGTCLPIFRRASSECLQAPLRHSRKLWRYVSASGWRSDVRLAHGSEMSPINDTGVSLKGNPPKERVAGGVPYPPPPLFGILLFYEYVALTDVSGAVSGFKALCTSLGLSGRLRISEEGVNGNLSGVWASCQAFCDRVRQDFPELIGTDFKLAPCNAGQCFRGLKVWESSEVCGLFAAADHGATGRLEAARSLAQAERGQHLSPEEWHQKLQAADDNVVLVDVRNRYETRIGHFAAETLSSSSGGSGTSSSSSAPVKLIDPCTRFFHEVPEFFRREETLQELRGKTVMMYCTGGVRCERASALLKQELADETAVLQLAGGIQRYLEAFPDGGFFKGSMHVFDRRGCVTGADCCASTPENGIDIGHHAAIVAEAKESSREAASATRLQEPRAREALHHDDDQSAWDPQAHVANSIIGQCALCGSSWDKYQGKWRCSRCSLLMLVCQHCQSSFGRDQGSKQRLVCELCEHGQAAFINSGETEMSPPQQKQQQQLKRPTTSKQSPPAELSSLVAELSERASQIAGAKDAAAAARFLTEVLAKLGSRRVRLDIAQDSNLLGSLRAIFDHSSSRQDCDGVEVAHLCCCIASFLLRDQASKMSVVSTLAPQQMATWVMSRSCATAGPATDALELLWRLRDASNARAELQDELPFWVEKVSAASGKHPEDVALHRMACLSLDGLLQLPFAAQASASSALRAQLCGATFRVAMRSAKLAAIQGEPKHRQKSMGLGGDLAAAALAAMLSVQRLVGIEAGEMAAAREIAEQLVSIYGKQSSSCRRRGHALLDASAGLS